MFEMIITKDGKTYYLNPEHVTYMIKENDDTFLVYTNAPQPDGKLLSLTLNREEFDKLAAIDEYAVEPLD